MKKIVYLAPALLLGLVGKGAMADQNTHISRLDAGFMTSLNESQPDRAANANKPEQEQVAQSKDAKVNETKKAITHISSLDSNYVIYNTLNVSSKNKSATYMNFAESKQVATNDDSEKYSVVNDTNNHNYSVNNPEQNKIIIHYVDENGKSISGLKDYTIDLTKQSQGTTKGQFNVPDNRYVLPDPNKQYDITNLRKTIHHDAITHVVHHDATGHYEDYSYQDGYTDTDNGTVLYGSGGFYSSSDGHDLLTTGEKYGSSVYRDDSGSVVTGSGNEDVIANPNNGQPAVVYTPHYATGSQWVEDSSAWDETVIDEPAYNETKGSTAFSEDDTLNIKSIVGNTVNVILKHGTKNVDIDNSDMELDSWRKVHVINSDNQNNLTNKSVKFKVGYTLDMVSLAKTANFNSSRALSDPNDFIGENNLTDPVGFSAINTKLLSISL